MTTPTHSISNDCVSTTALGSLFEEPVPDVQVYCQAVQERKHAKQPPVLPGAQRDGDRSVEEHHAPGNNLPSTSPPEVVCRCGPGSTHSEEACSCFLPCSLPSISVLFSIVAEVQQMQSEGDPSACALRHTCTDGRVANASRLSLDQKHTHPLRRVELILTDSLFTCI
ncbi:hypothetical protein EYF80_005739 [Liparis tanakae]|uniref:Uncharacterized protein n=1 Tax=Liparis tanakae TaxID=230148 RepID=A0A4Z2J2C1_9TELE|nr:hypothetical protein EYF80_005739 [Liparis tanakae]